MSTTTHAYKWVHDGYIGAGTCWMPRFIQVYVARDTKPLSLTRMILASREQLDEISAQMSERKAFRAASICLCLLTSNLLRPHRPQYEHPNDQHLVLPDLEQALGHPRSSSR